MSDHIVDPNAHSSLFAEKANLISFPINGDILITDANGNPVDSGKKFGIGNNEIPTNSQIALPAGYIQSNSLIISNNTGKINI